MSRSKNKAEQLRELSEMAKQLKDDVASNGSDVDASVENFRPISHYGECKKEAGKGEEQVEVEIREETEEEVTEI